MIWTKVSCALGSTIFHSPEPTTRGAGNSQATYPMIAARPTRAMIRSIQAGSSVSAPAT
jgi:hypothetical protein